MSDVDLEAARFTAESAVDAVIQCFADALGLPKGAPGEEVLATARALKGRIAELEPDLARAVELLRGPPEVVNEHGSTAPFVRWEMACREFASRFEETQGGERD